MGFKDSFKPLLLIGLAVSQHAVAEDQIPISSPAKVYNVTLNFDDLSTNSHGIGYQPSPGKPSALNYKSLFLQGLSVVNTSRADIENTDIQCAVSVPNALFSAASRKPSIPSPRISTFDTSQPFDASKPSRRTFKLIEMSLKPAGHMITSPDEPSVVAITFQMLKSPPDPAQGHGDAVDIFPGLLRGQPVPTLRTGAMLGVAFQGTSQKPFRLWPGLFRGSNMTGFGEGSDLLGLQAAHMRWKEKKGRWEVEDFGFCVDDVVFEVSEVGEGETEAGLVGGAGARQPESLDTPVIFKADGQLAVEGELEFEAMSHLLQSVQS